MKHVILTLLAVLFCAGLSAQNKEMSDTLQTLLNQASTAAKDKNYRKADCLYREAMDYAHAKSEKDIPEWMKQSIDANCFYNIACIYSLADKKEPALNALKNAIESGYSGYSWAMKDPDLDNIRRESYFKELMRGLQAKYDYPEILKKSGKYQGDAKDANLPSFTYLDPDDPRLVNLRKTLNLDSIAGNGDEISKIKNLCLWLHNTVRHDGSSRNPEEKNALALIKVCKEENRGVNCRMLSTILNECYLAMGFKSRFMTCMPKSDKDTDCHVVNIVWSNQLDKWIMADPSFYAFFLDGKGNLLGLEEARQMMIAGKTVKVNPEANWNGQKRSESQHLEYMAKNLYWFSCPVASTYDTETSGAEDGYAMLVPGDFKPWQNNYLSRDPGYFWARPE